MGRHGKKIVLAVSALTVGALAVVVLAGWFFRPAGRSQVQEREDGLWYQGVRYCIEDTFEAVKVYRQDAYVGSSRDGWVSYYRIEGDEAGDFLSAHQWDGKILYVREGGHVPVDGKPTAVYAEGGIGFWEVIQEEGDIETLLGLEHGEGEKVLVPEGPENGPYRVSTGLYVCYEGCPVAGGWLGWLYRTLDGWVFVSQQSLDITVGKKEDGDGQGYHRGILLKDRKLQDDLERIFSGLGT